MSEVMVSRVKATPAAPVPEHRNQTPPNLLSALATAQRLVEKGWCQEAYTRATDGKLIGKLDPDAAQHCLLSALGTALVMWKNETGNPEWLTLLDPLRVLIATAITNKGTLGFETARPPTAGVVIALWNDLPTMTQARVLTLLQEVMEEL